MSSKEVATAAYLGLEHKYPGLEIDSAGLCLFSCKLLLITTLSTGTLVDIVPDKETGLHTLLFKDKKKKRFVYS